MLNNRRGAREAALQALYQADSLNEWYGDKIDLFYQNFYEVKLDEVSENEVYQFSRKLVEGVIIQKENIDSLISEAAKNWSIDRMTRTDRNIIRIAVFELLNLIETPPSVVINEALEIAKRFSGDNSLTFINGVLDKISKDSAPAISQAQ